MAVAFIANYVKLLELDPHFLQKYIPNNLVFDRVR